MGVSTCITLPFLVTGATPQFFCVRFLCINEIVGVTSISFAADAANAVATGVLVKWKWNQQRNSVSECLSSAFGGQTEGGKGTRFQVDLPQSASVVRSYRHV